jgi:hypothetical protein
VSDVNVSSTTLLYPIRELNILRFLMCFHLLFLRGDNKITVAIDVRTDWAGFCCLYVFKIIIKKYIVNKNKMGSAVYFIF